jgi:hypothetical protein
MSQILTATLEARVARLERQNQVLRAAGATLLVAALATAGATVFAGQQISLVQKAQSFVIVAPDRSTRGTLELRGTVPTLSLLDEHGRERVRLTVGASGPSLMWTDQQSRDHELFSGPGFKPASNR